MRIRLMDITAGINKDKEEEALIQYINKVDLVLNGLNPQELIKYYKEHKNDK